ncbi:protein kinase [Paramyrothecium foliicola]|nr:protein kinase [Paramyrothecium foliicola]
MYSLEVLYHSPALKAVRRAHLRADIVNPAQGLSDADFETLPIDKPIVEENLPNYKAERYYAAHIGQILQDRYRIVGKLGFGGGSTVWACRDPKEDTLFTIKTCTTGERGTRDAYQEVAISNHIKSIEAPHHPGKQRLRVALDNFEIEGTFAEIALDLNELRLTSLWVAIGLDFLQQAGVIHTDLSPNNILVRFSPGEELAFKQIEELELATPTPRQVLPDRFIYLSYELGKTHGPVVITDYGAARLGDPLNKQKRSGDDFKIDMWSLGIMILDLFEGGSLFRAVSAKNLDDELHLAEMVSLLGSPPKKVPEWHAESRPYWDSEGGFHSGGNWIASTAIPDQSLERREMRLRGEDKQRLLALVRKVLCWLPEDRKSAYHLYDDVLLSVINDITAIRLQINPLLSIKFGMKMEQGVDARGNSLAINYFDDGQCYQINDGAISIARQVELKKVLADPQGADLWHQIDVQLPTDFQGWYTLYWVWTWPTGPTVAFPDGQVEVYTSCMDVVVTDKVVDGDVDFTLGQDLNTAGIADEMI